MGAGRRSDNTPGAWGGGGVGWGKHRDGGRSEGSRWPGCNGTGRQRLSFPHMLALLILKILHF